AGAGQRRIGQRMKVGSWIAENPHLWFGLVRALIASRQLQRVGGRNGKRRAGVQDQQAVDLPSSHDGGGRFAAAQKLPAAAEGQLSDERSAEVLSPVIGHQRAVQGKKGEGLHARRAV